MPTQSCSSLKEPVNHLIIIMLTLNEAHPFCNGVARVHVGGTLREVAIHAPPVWEGREWQLINRKGEELKRNRKWMDYAEDR